MTLTQRKPMARGKGFQRKPPTTRAPAGIEAPCGATADSGPIEHNAVGRYRFARPKPAAAPVQPAQAAIKTIASEQETR